MKVLGAALILLLGGRSCVYDLCGIPNAPHSWRMGFVDVPCSLAGDLLLRPVTLPFEICRK
jgi:hypothetical protein